MTVTRNKTERNYGLDLLRIISMCFVITMHILDHGGIFFNVPFFSANYKIAWAIELIAYCAVDCFVLISGYADSSPRTKYAHIIFLWMEVFFYSVAITGVFQVATHGIKGIETLAAFLPVTTKQYWFFTAYFGMFLLTPFLKKAVKAINKEEAVPALILLLVFYTILPIANTELFGLNLGYSVLWFSVLYITGGIIREHSLFAKTGIKKLLLATGILIAAIWLGKYGIESVLIRKYGLHNSYERLVSYTSPLIFALAVLFLLIFRQIQPASGLKKVIEKITPLVFGVYLIQDHNLIREHVIKNRFIPLIGMNPAVFFFSVAGSVILLFILCIAIDFVRSKIFAVIRARKIAERAEQLLMNILP